jgi:hypothetical protein
MTKKFTNSMSDRKIITRMCSISAACFYRPDASFEEASQPMFVRVFQLEDSEDPFHLTSTTILT